MPHPARLSDEQLLKQCDMTRQRGGGPGGQHRNKVATAVRLVHRPSGVAVLAADDRRAEVNRQHAVKRLRLALALKLRDTPEKDMLALWKPYIHQQKVKIKSNTTGYAMLVSDLLDRICLDSGDITAVAAQLNVSCSQVVKCVAQCPDALILVNQWRQEAGLFAFKA